VIPKPWSFTSLEDFINCPKAFYEKRIVKSVVEEASSAMLHGNYVHKRFECHLRDGEVLGPATDMHQPFMERLRDLPGQAFYEQKVAIGRDFNACTYFADNVWWRGVIDFKKVDGAHARIVDYKTGKKHEKFQQLKLFALHTFAAHPEVTQATVQFYWTQNQTTSTEVYTREQIPMLWSWFVPHLKQYKLAFQNDIWQPRQSGLCNGWCPVTSCQFWKPKRS
jgi:RecB family exonuclease